jgi:hypothetical protein
MQSNECIYICEQFSEYHENTLAEEIRAKVENHLDRCPLCKKTFNELSGIIQNIQQLPKIKTSESFTQNLLQKIEEEKHQGTWTRILNSSVTRVAGYAVAAGLIVALGINFWLDPINSNPQNPRSQYAVEKGESNTPAESFAGLGDSAAATVNDSLELQQTIQAGGQKMLLVNDSK